MQYLEELINKAQVDEQKNEKKSDVTVKTNKKIVVSKAFINRIQQSAGIVGSRAKNTGKGSKFLDSVKEKSIIKESDTVELKGIQVFSADPN